MKGKALLTKKKKESLTGRLQTAKMNAKKLWEENRDLRKAVNDAQKGLEQIEENVDMLLGVMILKLGGEVTITTEDMAKTYKVLKKKLENGYSFITEVSNEKEEQTGSNEQSEH